MRANDSYTPYGAAGERKYLTKSERQRFLATANQRPDAEKCLGLVLLWSGARLSEALALTTDSLDVDDGTLVIRSLKKRGRIVLRTVPVPASVMALLEKQSNRDKPQLWDWGRTKAWAVIKSIMSDAELSGLAATPRGLRHSFGVHAVMSGVPITLLQRWMGHSKLETTAIYTNVIGAEERKIAELMW